MKNKTATFLAIATMIGFLIVLLIGTFVTIPASNKEFFATGFTALTGFVTIVISYYLGSSQSSAHKTELLATTPVAPAAPPLDPTTAALAKFNTDLAAQAAKLQGE